LALGIQISSLLTLFLSIGGILLIGHSNEDKTELSILNIYGPCQNIKEFWASVEASGLLAKKNMIIAGDLNLTTSPIEILG